MKGAAAAQSAQRSKARKLRHIMQLEEEVQTLQGLHQQQLATISAMQQESSLLCESLLRLTVAVVKGRQRDTPHRIQAAPCVCGRFV